MSGPVRSGGGLDGVWLVVAIGLVVLAALACSVIGRA